MWPANFWRSQESFEEEFMNALLSDKIKAKIAEEICVPLLTTMTDEVLKILDTKIGERLRLPANDPSCERGVASICDSRYEATTASTGQMEARAGSSRTKRRNLLR